MNKEPENITEEQTPTATSKRPAKAARIALYAAAGLILLLGLFVSVLQFNTFPVKEQAGRGLSDYFAENDAFSRFSAAEQGFALQIPLARIDEELTRQALTTEKNVYNLEFDVAAGKAMINYKVQGFYIPVLYSLVPAEDEALITYRLQPKALGKLGLPLPGGLFKALNLMLQTSLPKGLPIPDADFQRYGWECSGWRQEETAVTVELGLAAQGLDEILMELKSLPENEVKYIFETGSARQKKLVSLLASYPASAAELKKDLAASYFAKDSLFKELLLLMNAELLEKTFVRYPFLAGKYSADELLEERSDLIAQSISRYGRELLKTAHAWMETSGGEFYNSGYPFLKKSLRTVSVADVITAWNLPISESISRRLHFGLDMADKKPAVLYIVDAASYIVIKEDSYFVADEQTYLARYQRDVPPAGELTRDSAVWQAICDKLKASFKTEELFIRYMKDDGKDAFVLLSFLEKPQDVQAVAFSKINDQWLPTASNFKNIQELQAQDAAFNLNLYTDSYEDPKLIYIDADALENIEEELSYAGKLPAGVKLVYYSYKDKYIYLKLSDGAEYLMTTYHQYLDKIYTREAAMTLFGEMLPQIILLQEPPMEAAVPDQPDKESGESSKQSK